ncbi:MAG: hypothetical protein ABI743_12155, partial [bacterium]
MEKLRVLAIHGVSNVELNQGWEQEWRLDLARGLNVDPAVLVVDPLNYDEVFAAKPPTGFQYFQALGQLFSEGLGCRTKARAF